MAGPSIHGDKKNRTHLRKQWQFHENHETWHDDVLRLMEDAGALSTKVPKMMKIAIFLLLTITTMYGYYADGAGGWGIAFPAIVAVIGYYFYPYRTRKEVARYTVLYRDVFCGSANRSFRSNRRRPICDHLWCNSILRDSEGNTKLIDRSLHENEHHEIQKEGEDGEYQIIFILTKSTVGLRALIY